jgi:hypothetical protein
MTYEILQNYVLHSTLLNYIFETLFGKIPRSIPLKKVLIYKEVARDQAH